MAKVSMRAIPKVVPFPVFSFLLQRSNLKKGIYIYHNPPPPPKKKKSYKTILLPMLWLLLGMLSSFIDY